MVAKKRKVTNTATDGCDSPKRVTPTEKKLSQAHYDGYCQGRREEQQLRLEQEKANSATDKQLKREQVVAVTALINATSQNLSKAGYLISQLNKEKGW